MFCYGFVMIGVAILTQGLKVRPGGAEIGVALGVAAIYLMVFARLGIPERSHLFEYGVAAFCNHEALTERKSQDRRLPVPALLALLAASLVGTLDECIQWILPSRVFEWTDILVNILSSLMAVVAMVVLSWARWLTSRLRHS